jgi:hypothetical protein
MEQITGEQVIPFYSPPFRTLKSLSVRLLDQVSADEAYVFFRRFMALKIGFPEIFRDGLYKQPSLTLFSVVVAVSIGVASLRRFYWPGILVLTAIAFGHVFTSWPFTLNHGVLEAVILLLILLDINETPEKSSLNSADMIKWLMVSVWIYSGLQKLFHGYFFDGQYFALEMLSGDSGLGKNLGIAFKTLESFFRVPGYATMQCCRMGPISLPAWEVGLFQLISFFTIVTELFLPGTLLFPATRKLGVILLFLFQLTVGLISTEMDFTYTVVAILFLFVPDYVRVKYGCLAILYMITSEWF